MWAARGHLSRIDKRGDIHMVFQQMCQVSVQVLVEKRLWVPYSSPPASPGLQEAGEGALPPEEVLSLHLAGEMYSAGKEKHAVSSWQKGSGVLCVSAAALQCPLHIPLQECPWLQVLGGLPGLLLPLHTS